MTNRESVWDYPRPPAIEEVRRHVRVVALGELIAESQRPILIKETSHPPVYFLPPEDVREKWLRRTAKTSFCEWKGSASYYDVVVGERALRAVAFRYVRPTQRFAKLAGWYSFYAGPMDSVTVDGEQVTPQEGGFYSGWITKNLVGPFKGAPGSLGW
jgi:uncharacterized protein (DUF427 family)